MAAEARRRLLRGGALRYAALAVTAGAGRDETEAALADAWARLAAGESGGEL